MLNADHQTTKVIDAMHLRMARGINHQGLARYRVRRAEIRDAFARGRDGGAGSHTIIRAGFEAGENAVEIAARVRHELPNAAELSGDMLHQHDIKAVRALRPHEFERRIGQRRAHSECRGRFSASGTGFGRREGGRCGGTIAARHGARSALAEHYRAAVLKCKTCTPGESAKTAQSS